MNAADDGNHMNQGVNELIEALINMIPNDNLPEREANLQLFNVHHRLLALRDRARGEDQQQPEPQPQILTNDWADAIEASSIYDRDRPAHRNYVRQFITSHLPGFVNRDQEMFRVTFESHHVGQPGQGSFNSTVTVTMIDENGDDYQFDARGAGRRIKDAHTAAIMNLMEGDEGQDMFNTYNDIIYHVRGATLIAWQENRHARRHHMEL